MALLEASDVNVLLPEEPGQEAFEKVLPQADALVLRTNVKLTKEALAKTDRLQIVCRTGAGIDNVDKDACREKGVLIANTPSANTISVVEHAVGLILAASKRFSLYDKAVRTGNWKFRSTYASHEIYGTTAGIVGLGKIGRSVADILHQAFHMNIVGFDPFAKQEDCPNYRLVDDPAELVAVSDVISLHCPSIPQTRGMINYKLLQQAKPTAVLVNCARGDVVVEDDLVRALKEGLIAGAGLDVFSDEPINPQSPLLEMNQVILTPHVAALTQEASVRVAVQAVEQALVQLSGGTPEFLVKD